MKSNLYICDHAETCNLETCTGKRPHNFCNLDWYCWKAKEHVSDILYIKENKQMKYKPTQEEIIAVEKTVKMWSWLRDNPKYNKEDYASKFLTGEEIRSINNHSYCFLCSVFNCSTKSQCPLDSKEPHCNLPNSSYQRWRRSEDRQANAQRIVIACEEWLEKYTHKKAVSNLNSADWATVQILIRNEVEHMVKDEVTKQLSKNSKVDSASKVGFYICNGCDIPCKLNYGEGYAPEYCVADGSTHTCWNKV